MCSHILPGPSRERSIGFDSAPICEPQIDHFVMAITAAEGIVRHIAPPQRLELPHVAAELIGWETQMRKITLFAVAAALITTGFGVWAASPARVSPSIGQGIEPFKLMVNAKNLSQAELVDYTFVFH